MINAILLFKMNLLRELMIVSGGDGMDTTKIDEIGRREVYPKQ